MRLPPNLKYFLFLLLVFAVITVATIYLPRVIPNIGQILTVVLVVAVGALGIFTFIKPMFAFLYARADGMLELYIDKSRQGFHVFTYHINSGGDPPGPALRTIYHYYVADTGRLYSKKVYSHFMEPVSGRSGWDGYTSFEESVLGSADFQKSLAKLSGKAGIPLQLGEQQQAGDDDSYAFSMDDKTITLQKFEGAVDEGVRVTCTSSITNEVLWKKKI